MEIHFISSLTVDDETRIATAVLSVASCLLDQFAIAYSVRIETSDGAVYQRTHPASAAAAVLAGDVAAGGDPAVAGPGV
jgi:hypothetical protein